MITHVKESNSEGEIRSALSNMFCSHWYSSYYSCFHWVVASSAGYFTWMNTLHVNCPASCMTENHHKPSQKAAHSNLWLSTALDLEALSTLLCTVSVPLTLCASPPSTGEGDEDDVCLGALSWPGGAEPQCSLETPGHLRLQHWASPLGRGGGMQVKRSILGQRWEQGWEIWRCAWNICTHWLVYLYIIIWRQRMLLCYATDCIYNHPLWGVIKYQYVI